MLFTALMAFNSQAQVLWEEGTHYRVIADEASKEKNITEFFSFWCPHCYNFEPIVAEIKKKKSNDVKFVKVHVNFMRSAGPDVQDMASQAMMVGRALNKDVEVNGAIFSHIHRDRKLIASKEDLQAILARTGITAEQFDKAWDSFAVKGMMGKNAKLINEFRRHVSGVPNFIVNGKYQATFQRGMSADDMVDLIVWLSELD
ncbi:thiol:disulfide interchange protein DsbA [Planctobacterium marinum]|uniref:Thiol:disulfide interchange protein n=2 Tax=Planctobacterium marinum TaxID=1631968 RepID=A0AA48KWA5_9ALTE|nr:thiol:disulfide interchange protein DsbA [Planctobacterium marinum]